MPNRDQPSLRKDYSGEPLDERTFAANPIEQFGQWYSHACAVGLLEPNAMALGTTSREGIPSVRMVLLKGVDQRGFRFFTNSTSRKGQELEESGVGALCFYWDVLERQVRVVGKVSKCSRDETECYFRTRPREAQIAAYASAQSRPLASRDELSKRMEDLEQEFSAEVPLPSAWSGYIVSPFEVEFWQGMTNRAHERLRYRWVGAQWELERLQP